jgi:hypothetical protein
MRMDATGWGESRNLSPSPGLDQRLVQRSIRRATAEFNINQQVLMTFLGRKPERD